MKARHYFTLHAAEIDVLETGAATGDEFILANYVAVNHLVKSIDMSIIINLDVVMAKRKERLNAVAEAINLSQQNLSILKTGKAKAIRFSTLEALCEYLDCQPGDILEYKRDEADVDKDERNGPT